jgi:hemoglobin
LSPAQHDFLWCEQADTTSRQNNVIIERKFIGFPLVKSYIDYNGFSHGKTGIFSTTKEDRESRDMYENVGGEKVINKLVDDFYHIMATDPLAKDCFYTHAGKDIAESAHKLKYFLSGWLGGPQLYMQKFGHPRLRMRHSSFKIGLKERDQWTYCMQTALRQSTIPDQIKVQILRAFESVAEMVRNSD